MKRLYTIALCAALCISSVYAAPNRFAPKRNAKKHAKTMVVSRDAAAKLWRPAEIQEYYYDEGEWVLIAEAAYTYDAKGNPLTETLNADGEISTTTFTYNSDNMVTSKLVTVGEEAEEQENASKLLYTYDPIVKSFCIERMGYDWNGNGWEENYFCEKNEITRNSNGNIESIVKLLPLDGDLLPAYKGEWHYNATTGQADEYAYYYNYEIGTPDWILYDDIYYKNILWENTDGQMTDGIEDLLEGANRVKQADVYYEDELDGHLFVTYTGDKDYIVKQTTTDPSEVGVELVRMTLDENGSYSMSELIYMDEDDNFTAEPFMGATETYTYDEHGNMTEYLAEEFYADESYILGNERYDYEYDPEGNPTQLTVYIYDEDEDDLICVSRMVYNNYVDVAAGIEEITVDQNVSREIFNLNGVKVSGNLQKGIYIVREGSKISKIAVR